MQSLKYIFWDFENVVYRLNILNDDKHIENIDFYKYI